jgi:hypothetical protein
MREKLAAQVHQQWSDWMIYLFKQGRFHWEGHWTMPASKVRRWQRQMRTPYEALPENEKMSDRILADRLLEITHPPTPTCILCDRAVTTMSSEYCYTHNYMRLTQPEKFKKL